MALCQFEAAREADGREFHSIQAIDMAAAIAPEMGMCIIVVAMATVRPTTRETTGSASVEHPVYHTRLLEGVQGTEDAHTIGFHLQAGFKFLVREGPVASAEQPQQLQPQVGGAQSVVMEQLLVGHG